MMTMNQSNVEKRMPRFDGKLTQSMVGKRVLIGLTYYDHMGTVVEQKQMHGTIISASARDGFAIELKGMDQGKIYWLPPDPAAFHEAEPGEYRLRSTGEVVTDPDLLCTWEIHKPAPESEADK